MEKLQTYDSLFQKDLAKFYDAEEIKNIFYIVIKDVLGLSKMQYSVNKELALSEEQSSRISNILKDLLKQKPIQHILKKADFFGEVFEVNPFVLIPRSETEELVDLIIRNHRDQLPLRIIDIGTGSGCIPISLKKHLPEAHISALDISKEAIATARRNALRLDAPINFVNADILEWEYIFQSQQYDIIVSNPPYITPKEKEEMHPNVLEFEPHLALFVEETAPLLFYETIASFALKHLTAEGDLYFEINQYYGDETVDMLQKKGFKTVILHHDMQQNPRMIHAKK
ncbi:MULTISPECIES: peptide chain release factor N(5)-glutamine methyltransferase [unclassified Sphingobacterium]|uniref:peptide chain release factor N(5)-glutamine methyltransferase n=1 Tax=unclassified Sphingobacterium TaxID=2609468 RepID=UPI00038A51E4|nr:MULTISPECIES: peptide chain release factor N(5)-glutamine methyltransferase [unclassified Sphingobacterium]KKX48529.1 N5-glutamine S-adenosyl-L-methionine-dependent methyltransferase [Sphingobacterium sp. IITKGP-BTPF85]NJI75917.1 peptide chain release factor N(5)-glutamine methyltransferase [Sphingobacterium sp. B16(2022)]